MHREGIPSKSVSESEQVSFETICTCKSCDHGLARDCAKAGCRCCKKEHHSMIMDGMEGFVPTDTQE